MYLQTKCNGETFEGHMGFQSRTLLKLFIGSIENCSFVKLQNWLLYWEPPKQIHISVGYHSMGPRHQYCLVVWTTPSFQSIQVLSLGPFLVWISLPAYSSIGGSLHFLYKQISFDRFHLIDHFLQLNPLCLLFCYLSNCPILSQSNISKVKLLLITYL